MDGRKVRSDKDQKRIPRAKGQEPVNFSFQLRRDDPVEAKVLKAVESDFRRLKTTQIKSVLIPWLMDFLGIEKELS